MSLPTSTHFPARPNVEDRRDNETPAFMTGTLPPKVEVLDEVYREAFAAVLTEVAPMDLVGSHQYRGADRDREAGARFTVRRLPESPEADRLVITNGTQSAVVILMAGLVGVGGVLAVEELSYPPVQVFADMLGIRVVPVGMDDEGLRPDALVDVCREHRPCALYTMPTLHNPTTAVMSVERRQAIADLCREYGVAVIEDDIYGVLLPSAPPPLASYLPDLGWYILGTAKSIAAGLKVAYVVGPSRQETGRLFWPGVRATNWMVAPANAAVVTHLIENGGADRVLDAVRRELRHRQSMVDEELRGTLYRAMPESPLVWLELPDGMPRREFVAQVLSRGAEIGTSDHFVLGRSNDKAPNAVRFGIGAPPRAAFGTGLQAIASAYHGRH